MLTRSEAAARADLLTIHGYAVSVDLTRGDTVFGSTTSVRFGCARPGAETFVELRPAELHSVTLNGRPLDPAGLAGNRLPLHDLEADNELVVHATMAYSSHGEGLHRFVDPADGEVYLYAQSFLDNAQRVFACFDQPDLKAPVTLAVRADPQWTVLSNATGRRTAPGEWAFEPTVPLSTYLVTLVAGPYRSWYRVHKGIPLGVHCRASLADHLARDADELFTVTRQCLDRYHELFDVPYPFGKYDQAFVPEFSVGAMENAGCVTFRDELVFRSAVTEAERQWRAVGIAHEMAHMWFGDLVTMRWWDDLWLNESFAEYLGYRVVAEATRFTGAWTAFAVGRKVWGYAADQRPTTHPVAPDEVPDTEAALLNFDGISYAKGAAVLRQLVAWLGDAPFLGGLTDYFRAHAYGNATLADLLDALSRVSERDLSAWSGVWLRTAHVNTVHPEVDVSDGRYRQVTLRQTAHPVLRPHRIGVGCYDGVTRTRHVELTVDSGQTVVHELTGQPVAPLLLVNDDDLTYAKVRWAGAVESLPALADPLARAVLWSALWDATRDAEVPAARFVELTAAALPQESEPAVYAEMVEQAVAVAVAQYLPPQARPRALSMLADACHGSIDELAAARGLARCGGPDDLRRLPDWLEADAELRWLVLYRLVVLGAAGAAEIDAEAERDRSAHGHEHAARCRAALPDAAAKAAAWESIVDGRAGSHRLLLATAEGFWQPEHDELTKPYVERYFTELPRAVAGYTPHLTTRLAAAAFPRFAVGEETMAAARALLDRDGLPAALRRAVLDVTDDLRRALAARRLA